MLLADGALGQMMEPVELAPEGQTVLPEKPWAANGHENKRKRNIINSLYIQPDVLEKIVLIATSGMSRSKKTRSAVRTT